jgi:hypothetical protein
MADQGVFGQQELNSGNSPFNELAFVVQMMLSRLNVATLVKVVAVSTSGGVSPVGTVDVLPLVNQVAGDGSAVPHTTIFGLPYLRIQGGANAVIVDPKVDDIGFCVFADRDISSVQASGAQGNPGSARRFDMADGLYFGGWNLSTTPVNYLQVNDSHIQAVFGSTSVVIDGSGITLNGNLTVNGTGHVTGAFTGDSTGTFSGDVTGNGTSLHTHKHGGVSTGIAQTGVPV